MIGPLQNLIIALFLVMSFSSCKKDLENKDVVNNQNTSFVQRSYFDFNSTAEDSIFAQKLLDEARLIGEFKVKSLTRYSLKLAPLGDKNFSEKEQYSFKKNLNLSDTYGIKIGDEPLRLFKFSEKRIEDDRIIFTNNIKWLSYPVKKNLKDIKATIYKVNYDSKDWGIATVSTIGDPRMYRREAQELRKSLDALFGGQLLFVGNSEDTNRYSFYDYGVYTHRHVVKAIDDVKKSDYYIISMGLNDYESPFESVTESLDLILSKLKSKNPEGQILLTTLPEVSGKANDSDSRNSFYQAFNQYIRGLTADSNLNKVKVIDLAKALQNDRDCLKPNGVHLSQRGYTLYADLISEVLLSNQELKSHYKGQLENFDSFPLSEQVLFSENSNATSAGNFKLSALEGRTFLTTQLNPTIGVKGPHRAEMTASLEPYYSNNEIWLGVDFNVSSTYDVDSINTGSRSMLLQIHSKPNEEESWSSYQKNLPFNRPSIGFYLVKTQESYRIELYYGLNGKPDKKYKDLEWSLVGKANIEPDTWNRLDLHFKLSHENDGYIAAWINQNGITSQNGSNNKIYGPNMHNEARPYLKFGQYRYWEDSHLHEVYFDNLKAKRNVEDYFYPNPIPTAYSGN